ncbi:MAG: hypothetical protein ACTSPT_08120 [Candidatus Heimdallarchaeota archaeon]
MASKTQEGEELDSISTEGEIPSRVATAFKGFLDNSLMKFRTNFEKENWSEIGFTIAVIFALTAIGMFVRVLLAYNIRDQYGFGSDIIWNRYVPFNLGVPFRGFSDFRYYYVAWITAWYENDWYPYQWTEPFVNNPLNSYSYPPLFLYFLISVWRPGMTEFWMAFPMILADAACAGVVYLILKNIIKNEHAGGIALFGGFLMAVAPINIIYDGLYWLNPGPVTLLTLITFYFATKSKWWQAFFWLALATMTKQNALFFTYPLFMAMLGEKIRKKSIKESVIESLFNALLFVFILILVSVPWIFISPIEYGRHMMFPGKQIEITTDVYIDPAGNDCVSFPWSLLALGFPDWIIKFASFGTYSMFFMILISSIISVFMMWRAYNKKSDGIEFYEWISVYMIYTHIFMPRGVYKFYTAYFVPIILIALIGSLTNLMSKKSLLPISLILSGVLFLGFNFWLLVIARLSVPFFLFMTTIVIGFFAMIRGYLRDRMKSTKSKNSMKKYFEGTLGS